MRRPAKDLLNGQAASIDNETLSKIDTQAASSAAVESSPLSPHHQEEKERLERLLQNRSEAKELEDKNILKRK